jgi:hypothetical protein
MSTMRPAAGGAVSGSGLMCALLVLVGLLAVACGPELVAWVHGTPATKAVPYYLLAVAGLLVVCTLLFRGGGRPEGEAGARVRCRACGASNEEHARYCNQCAAPM